KGVTQITQASDYNNSRCLHGKWHPDFPVTDFLWGKRSCQDAVEPARLPNVGSNSNASKYAAAPQARVTFNPNWIAITIASTEPSTLDAAFIAHAHSTAPLLMEGMTSLSMFDESARKPLGKGIPMARPSGISSAALISSFTTNGKPTSAPSSGGKRNTQTNRAITMTAIAQATRVGSWNQRRESRLPMPLESSIRKMTTVSAYVGFPRNKTKRWMKAISTRMYPNPMAMKYRRRTLRPERVC